MRDVVAGIPAGAPLRQRGCLTVWITDEAVAGWQTEPRTTPGCQPHHSALGITTALTMRAIFHLALRQTEGVFNSVVALLGLALTVAPMTRTECARLFPGVLWMPR
jgi:Transposase DDE domain